MKILIAALGASTLLAGAALAAPVSSSVAHQSFNIQSLNGSVIDIQDRRGHRDGRRDGRPRRHRFAPGPRHRAAPRGWRRHGRRPHDWRTRGCIVVGPVWFCP